MPCERLYVLNAKLGPTSVAVQHCMLDQKQEKQRVGHSSPLPSPSSPVEVHKRTQFSCQEFKKLNRTETEPTMQIWCKRGRQMAGLEEGNTKQISQGKKYQTGL